MTPQQHVEKAVRITEAMGRISVRDYEMVIEAAMLAGTHWLNVALHKQSLTDQDTDVMHAEYMTVALRTRTRLVLPGLIEALDEIEQMRPFFVRGDVSGGEGAAGRCLELLALLRTGAERGRLQPQGRV